MVLFVEFLVRPVESPGNPAEMMIYGETPRWSDSIFYEGIFEARIYATRRNRVGFAIIETTGCRKWQL